MVKNLLANAGDPGFDPWVKKIPGEDNGNPLQYACLGMEFITFYPYCIKVTYSRVCLDIV